MGRYGIDLEPKNVKCLMADTKTLFSTSSPNTIQLHSREKDEKAEADYSYIIAIS